MQVLVGQEITYPFVRRRGPVALIGLSTAVPTRPFMATGELGREQMQRLAAALDRACEDGLFRVVLIHHPAEEQPGPSASAAWSMPGISARCWRSMAPTSCCTAIIMSIRRAELPGPSGMPPSDDARIGVPSASEGPPGEHAGYNSTGSRASPGAWRFEVISRGLTEDEQEVVELKRGAVAAA